MSITIYGASDDLIEIEGDIREEWSVYDEDGLHIACSDGTLLSINYTGGFWRINRIATGTCAYEKVEATDEDDDYSDKVTLTGEVRWVALTKDVVKP